MSFWRYLVLVISMEDNSGILVLIIKFGLVIGCASSWMIIRAFPGIAGVFISGICGGSIIGITMWIILQKFRMVFQHFWKVPVSLVAGWTIGFMSNGFIIYYDNTYLNWFVNSDILWIAGYVLGSTLTGIIGSFTVNMVLTTQHSSSEPINIFHNTSGWVKGFAIGGGIGIVVVNIVFDLFIHQIYLGNSGSLVAILVHGLGGSVYGIISGTLVGKTLSVA